jgi:protein SCO1
MNGRKVILLGITLLLPVLAFLFLQSFGRNAYKLRTYLPERIASGPVGAQTVSDAVSADTIFHRVDDAVSLTTASGQPFSPARDLRDLVVILSFGRETATATERVDRAVLRGLARVQERYQARPAVKLLTIVPGATNGLAAIAERSGAIGGKWTFAVADEATLMHLRSELRDSASLENSSSTSRLWLLDRERHLRGFYKPTDPREIDRLLTEVDVLLKIEQNPVRQ